MAKQRVFYGENTSQIEMFWGEHTDGTVSTLEEEYDNVEVLSNGDIHVWNDDDDATCYRKEHEPESFIYPNDEDNA